MKRTMPTMGAKGIRGQSKMRARLKMPPKTMMTAPMMRRINLEKKPMMRETRRSMNIWNLRSREESALAEAAEIWRKGWKRVRIRESMEKKSVILARVARIF